WCALSDKHTDPQHNPVQSQLLRQRSRMAPLLPKGPIGLSSEQWPSDESRVKISQFPQRHIILGPLLSGATDDYVIEDFDLKNLPGSNQIPGHLDVRLRRCRITARVVMCEHHGRGIRGNSRFKDLSRMYQN